jgi:hypothetical protein
MYFSVGILYSAHEFLRFIKSNPKTVSNFPESFKTFNNIASIRAVFAVCQKCEWVTLDIEGYLVLTDRAESILGDISYEQILRIQLQHMVEAYKPSWIGLLTRGRSESLKYLSADVIQCLREAGLTESYSDDVILWWDKIGKISRRTGKDEKIDIGRRGEKMSLDFERKRTKREPRWQGFESNYSGYDVLSIVDRQNTDPLNIEVKTSNSKWEDATFYISRNEWTVAKLSANYLFYLWALVPKKTLYIVSVEEIEKHTPVNKGMGTWESVEIPFSAICQKDQFINDLEDN